MRTGGILLIFVLVTLGICINYVAADQVELGIDFYNIVLSEGSTDITVTATNSSGAMVGNLINFAFDNSTIGYVTPLSGNTNSDGKVFSTFYATTQGGVGNLTITVHYYEDSQLKEYSHSYKIQVIPYLDLIKIETRDINTDAEKKWVVANGNDKVKASVWPINISSGYHIPYLESLFSISPTEMGTIAPSIVVTGADGRADSIFTSGTKSGEVEITGKVIIPWGSSNNLTTLYIDHDSPYAMNWLAETPSEALVGENVTIKVRYRDSHNNSIDNRRFTEYVTFNVTSPSSPNATDQAGFWNGAGFSPSLTNVPLDTNGIATVLMKMDNRPGTNIITLSPQFTGVNPYETWQIEGISEAPPVVVEQEISSYAAPDPYPNIPADGASVFNITYTLRDQFGNPVRATHFWMNTSVGDSESRLLVTNEQGQVKVTYGPKIRTDLITITATAVAAKPDGTHATDSKTVEVISSEPVQMALMAIPQYIPSWDVGDHKTATITAVVMDKYGNPVKNQLVDFSIVEDWEYAYSSDENEPHWTESSLLNIQKNTSTQANAVLYFRPGYFPGSGYPQEDDSCTITAQWASYTPQIVKIHWTNAPFLSISTNVSPMIAAWSDEVTVNIKVEGDGYALRPKPVDVVLLLDYSSSMMWDIENPGVTNYERWNTAKSAAKSFISNLNPERDQVGLVSFNSIAVERCPLTNDFTYVNNTIDSLSLSPYTNIRHALKLGIEEIQEHGREDAIKTVILLSDGEWNTHGTPIAHGTGWQGYSWEYMVYPNDYEYYDGLGGTLTQTSCNDWQCNDWRCTGVARKWYPNGPYYCTGWTCDDGGCIDGDCSCNNWACSAPSCSSNCDRRSNWDCNAGDCVGETCYWKCTDGENTNQNMSIYAHENNARVYSIFFADDPTAIINSTFQTITSANGGLYEFAPTAARLTEIFEEIAGLLREEAGVGVTMDLPFDAVTIESAIGTNTAEGYTLFDYLPYTNETKYWFTNGTSIYQYPNRDDSLNWTAESQINFNIGTMRLNQAWEATYHLKIKNNTANVGKITLFDEDSVIRFNDGKFDHTLSLPTTFFTCIGDQSTTPIGGEEAGYDLDDPTIQNTIVTQTFTRLFMVNNTPWNEPWYRTWYEDYFISIPGYLGKTKIGSRTIPAPVPLQGSYTFDLSPYLPEGVTSVDFNFYVEGRDDRNYAGNKQKSTFAIDRSKIYILLQ